MSERWSLFLDESGDFSNGVTSWVGGVLVEASAAALGRRKLPEEFERIYGPGPYPPHASHQNIPAAAALHAAWVPRGRASVLAEGALAAERRAELRAAADVLAAGAGSDVLAKVRAGARPSYDDLQHADDVLQEEAPHLRHVLSHLQGERQRQMGDLVARLFGRLEGRASYVGALGDGGAPGPETAPGHVREDAYVRALSVVAERVARLGGDVVIDVHVLTRDVEVGGFPKPLALNAHFVRQLAEAACARVGGRVRFRPAPAIQRYADHPSDDLPFHPMLAIADWVTNRVRPVLHKHHHSWATVTNTLVARSIAPSEAALNRRVRGRERLGPLPTIAAAGPLEAAVRDAFAGQPEGALPPGSTTCRASPRWWSRAT